VSESAPSIPSRHGFEPNGRGQRRVALVVGLVAILAVAGSAWAASLLLSVPTRSPQLELAPLEELDRRWGTYLSEREWGNPREAVGSNGWGLSWRGAIDTEYRYSDDGISGITDSDNEFRLGWAFWDGREEHVTERFLGATNPQGQAGETIIDDRIFRENTVTHSYSRLIYRYPPERPAFTIELESAKLDSNQLALSATATNISNATGSLDIVLKGWLAPGGTAEPLQRDGAPGADPTYDGLLLRGEETVVAIVGNQPHDWQVSQDKGSLDENLREIGALAGYEGGHIGVLAYHLEIPPAGVQTVRFALAEASFGAQQEAPAAARETLSQASALIDARGAEAGETLKGEVVAHEELYRQALMSLIWNESYYRWDGASDVNPQWAGKVDARDVLIMPDKWEFPWIASWDSAFHAVTAALVDADVAKDQIRFLLSDRWQQPDGHVPCAEWVMDDECPPIFAWAAWRIFEASRDRDFLAEVYPRLQLHYDYWWQNHLVEDDLFTGGFLGMDNLPRANRRAQADASAWMAFFARDMATIASQVGDAPASQRYWADRGRIQEQMNARLWDEESGFYYDLTASGRFLRHKSYSGLIPLIAGVVPAERLPRILEKLRDEDQFLSVGGIRSMSADGPLYQPGLASEGVNSNWRGPVWLPINYLLIQALQEADPELASDLRQRVVSMVERDWQKTGRFHEFFDGDTGEGLGADAQAGWTALVANLIMEAWPAEQP
jgi:hypothetical protein